MSESPPDKKAARAAQPAAQVEQWEPAEQGPEVALEPASRVNETGGPAGPEPTRYGDWERKGRCIDF